MPPPMIANAALSKLLFGIPFEHIQRPSKFKLGQLFGISSLSEFKLCERCVTFQRSTISAQVSGRSAPSGTLLSALGRESTQRFLALAASNCFAAQSKSSPYQEKTRTRVD